MLLGEGLGSNESERNERRHHARPVHQRQALFRLQRMGLASAMGYLVFMLILVLTLINFRLEKKWVFYE